MKTYKDVINLLIQTTDDLYAGRIKPEVAKQICSNVQTIINAARLQLDICKAQNKFDDRFLAIGKGDLDAKLKEISETCPAPIKQPELESRFTEG
jgi:hypothetical protein